MTLEERVEAFGGALSMCEVVGLGPLDWLTRQLVETKGARARLRHWLAAGRPVGPFEPNVFALSNRLIAAAEEVWGKLPPPVAWHASAGTLITGIDLACAGASGYAPRLSVEATFDQQLQMICVDGLLRPNDLASVVAHEVAHCFTGAILTRDKAIGSRRYQEVRLFTADICENPPDAEYAAAIEELARSEELANLLAAQWGFSGAGADINKLRRRGALNYVKEGFRA